MEFIVGKIYEGTITRIMPFGAFVRINDTEIDGLIHISEVSLEYIEDINTVLAVGQKVQVMATKTNDDGKINFSIKKALKSHVPHNRNNYNKGNNKKFDDHHNDTYKNKQPNADKKSGKKSKPIDFDDMVDNFLKESEDRLRGVQIFKKPNKRRKHYK